MKFGARQAKPSALRKLVAAATARDLRVLVVPGPDVARAYGLDLGAAGLRRVATPRHANVLLLVGTIPPALLDAAAILYAQMPRPRALLGLGAEEYPGLPAADVQADLGQDGLLEGVARLRETLSRDAFRLHGADYDAPVLAVRTEYTCPMHPEIVRDEPGSCPKCGMNLVPREADASASGAHGHEHLSMAAMAHEPPAQGSDTKPLYTCPMHPEVIQDQPGSCPKCGMNLVLQDNHAADSPGDRQPPETAPHPQTEDKTMIYTCPMHPEVTQDGPGSCPKCGMFLVAKEEVVYTCPMHPEVRENQPGSCPKCGMNLVPEGSGD